MDSTANADAEQPSHGCDENQVCNWLQTLLHPDFNHEPEEFYIEKRLHHDRLQKHPDYVTAAKEWPRYANEYDSVAPLVFGLFQEPKTWNFVQWYLEYARQTYPELVGTDALSNNNMLRLTDYACAPTGLTPDQVAASLSLHHVLEHNARRRRDGLAPIMPSPERSGLFGTPVFCAFAGSCLLPMAFDSQHWYRHFNSQPHRDNRSAQTTIQLLFRSNWLHFSALRANSDPFERAILCMAFVTSLWLKVPALFDHVIHLQQLRRYKDYSSLQHILGFIDHPGVPNYDESILEILLTSLGDAVLPRILTSDDDDLHFLQLLGKFVHNNCIQLATRPIKLLQGDKLYASVLHRAIRDNEEFMLQRLTADPRFDANAAVAGGTIIHIAAQNGHVEAAVHLLDLGADPNMRDDEGRNALMLAEGDDVFAALLLHRSNYRGLEGLAAAVDTAATDYRGHTIWHYAALTSELRWMQMLLECRPETASEELAICNGQGYTALDCALRATLLLQRRVLDSNMDRSSYAPQIRLIHLLLEKNAPLTPPNAEWNPAHFAVAWGDVEIVKTLLKRGLDFCGSDTEPSALFRLNMAASPALVKLMLRQHQKQGRPLVLPTGITPADTIVSIHPLYIDSSQPGEDLVSLSHHPGCLSPLDPVVFRLLLTPAAVSQRDDEGLTYWERFCAWSKAIVRTFRNHKNPRVQNYFMSAIDTALPIILKETDAIKLYEVTKGKPGWAALVEDLTDDVAGWACEGNPGRMQRIVEASSDAIGRSHVAAKIPSGLGTILLSHFPPGLLHELIKRVELPVHKPLVALYGRTVLEMTMATCVDSFEVAIAACTPDMINMHRNRYINCLRDGLKDDAHMTETEITSMLNTLLARGLRCDFERGGMSVSEVVAKLVQQRD